MRISDLLDKVGVGWKVAALAVSLLGLGAAGAKTMSTIVAIPSQLTAHDERLKLLIVNGNEWTNSVLNQNRLLLEELKQIRHDQAVLLCVKIAELRHTDWGRCLFEPHASQ